MLRHHSGCSKPRIPATNRGNLCVVLVGVLASLLAWSQLALAQGGWHQTEFMIGTWEDPVTASSLADNLHYLQVAKDAYFNLLTCEVVHYGDGYIPPGTVAPHFSHTNFVPMHHPKLQAAGKLGLNVLVYHDQITFIGGNTAPAPASIPSAFPDNLFSMYDQTGSDAITNEQNNALLGYNLGDEPDWTNQNADFIKFWMEKIHANDAARNDGHYRPAYINLQAGCIDLPGYSCPYPSFASRVAMIVNDPNPSRQIDVVSTALYPFRTQPVNPTFRYIYWEALNGLRATMGSRPFWIISMASPSADGTTPYAFSDPDENQSRFMAFCPVAAGAKGILWFDYRNAPLMLLNSNDYPVLGNDIPTCKLFRLKTINHYLHEVLGPVVMTTNHLGVFHQVANQPPMDDPPQFLPLVSGASAASCPPDDLGNVNFAVGVFQPSGSNEYYLLLVNKALSSKSGTVHLRASYASYSIGASPSVIGYVGGSAFTPIGTGPSFAVSLAGGEGRLYHLTPAPTLDFALTAPLGGETWRTGESHTVTWSPSNTAVNVDLVADALENGPGMTGPSWHIADGVSGGSYTFTVSQQVSSRAAHIVVSSLSGSNPVQSHNVPIITAPFEPAGSPTSWSFDAGGCVTLGGTLALDATGKPAVAYTRFPLELRVERYDGNNGWNSIDPFDGQNSYGNGVSAEVAFDASNHPHVAHLSDVVQTPSYPAWVMHTYQDQNNNWVTNDKVTENASPRANCALAISGSDVIVAFRGFEEDGRNLKVLKRVGSNNWVDFSTAALPVIANPHDISLATDASNNVYVAFINGDPSNGPLRGDHLGVLKITPSTAAEMTNSGLDGQFGTVSLSLDSNGLPAVAYTEDTAPDGSRRLRYRAYNGSSWSSSIPDNSIQTIADCALAFEGTSPRIAYISNRVAKYAQPNGNAWDLTTVYWSADAEGPIALRINNSNGSRWISFFDRSAGRYRVVGPTTNGGGGCDPCEMEAFHMVSSNPVVRGGSLKFDLRLSRAARLDMGLFDVAGRRVARFSPQTLAPGERQVQWQLGLVRPGAYFLRVSTDGGVVFRRALVVLN